MHRTRISREERHWAFVNAEARRLGAGAAEVDGQSRMGRPT